MPASDPRKTADERRNLEGKVREVIRDVVLPALGSSGHSFDVEIPRYGKSSLVYLVDVEGDRSFVLRVEPRIGAWLDLHKRRLAMNFWNRRGLPTPALLHHDLSPWTRLRTGLFFLCERRIEGGNVVDCPADHGAYEAMGRALAKIHSVIRRRYHGSLFQPRAGSYGYRFVLRQKERMRFLTFDGAVSQEDGAEAMDWMEVHTEALARLPGYNLIHRRCTESDVMFDADGEAQVLEPQRSGFGVFATDLVRAETRICRDDPEKIRRFHQSYFEAAPTGQRELYAALAPAFRADLHLANAYRWARRRARGSVEAEQGWSREFEQFRAITGA